MKSHKSAVVWPVSRKVQAAQHQKTPDEHLGKRSRNDIQWNNVDQSSFKTIVQNFTHIRKIYLFHCFGFVLLLLLFLFLLCFLLCSVFFFSDKLSRWQDKFILRTICNSTVPSKMKVNRKTKWEKGLKTKLLRDEQAKRNVSMVS